MRPRKDTVRLNLKSIFQHIVATLIGFFFLSIGTKHFIDPVWFEPIIPPNPRPPETLGIRKWRV